MQTEAVKIAKINAEKEKTLAQLELVKQFAPIGELLGGVILAEYGNRQGWFGNGFSAWLETQGLELALAGIIALQVMNQNPEALKAVGSAGSLVLTGLTKGIV